MPRKVVVVQCPLEDDETIQDLCSVRDLRPRNRCQLIFAMVNRYRTGTGLQKQYRYYGYNYKYKYKWIPVQRGNF
jgi:hypothetical protein